MASVVGVLIPGGISAKQKRSTGDLQHGLPVITIIPALITFTQMKILDDAFVCMHLHILYLW